MINRGSAVRQECVPALDASVGSEGRVRTGGYGAKAAGLAPMPCWRGRRLRRYGSARSNPPTRRTGHEFLRHGASVWAALAFALAATACEGPSEPVRVTDLYDFRLVGTDLAFHWAPEHLPVRFYADTAGRIPEYVQLGIWHWERQFLYGEFRGTLVAASTSADVIIDLQGDAPPDVPLSDAPPRVACEGVTIVPPIEGDSVQGFRFDQPLRISMWWFAGEAAEDVVNCLARVTVHEIGHALGIFAHSPNRDDLMFTRPEVTAPSLRDRATIQVLYHTPSDITPYRP